MPSMNGSKYFLLWKWTNVDTCAKGLMIKNESDVGHEYKPYSSLFVGIWSKTFCTPYFMYVFMQKMYYYAMNFSLDNNNILRCAERNFVIYSLILRQNSQQCKSTPHVCLLRIERRWFNWSKETRQECFKWKILFAMWRHWFQRGV